ncbi:MAG: DNA repair protein RecO [Alphaproteobacteria bacterium]|nr:DNA repair protein RecO [Alphaproteobacteria bacterium]
MKFESVGIIIGLRPFGERDAIAKIFTREYGLMAGMLRGALAARKNKPLVGQCGNASWNARLDSQLGVFHWESVRNLSAPLMSDPVALGFMNSAFALLSTLLPERAEDKLLFDNTMDMLGNTSGYISWEMDFLRSLGYALDLSKCSGCGQDSDLTRLSQRTGRAVCSGCAAPYLSQTFPLPVDLATTRFFLERVGIDLGTKLPIERMLI